MDSRLLMTLQVKVAGAQKIGAVLHGTRVTAPIASGHFEGPRLRGKVLPGGGDWTLLRGDGVLELDLCAAHLGLASAQISTTTRAAVVVRLEDRTSSVPPCASTIWRAM